MKIAIFTHGFSSWGGGIDFIRHLVSSISLANKDEENKNNKIYLILPASDFRSKLKSCFRLCKFILLKLKNKNLQFKPIVPSRQFFLDVFSDLQPFVEFVFSGSDLNAQKRTALNLNVDIIFPCIEALPKNFPIPWVGYIYDFQHVYYPDFFSKEEIQLRDEQFYKILNNASDVIVNASSVKNDAHKFIKEFNANIHVLPFSPCPNEAWLSELTDVRPLYNIKKNYFLISNQFWKHKDHESAFKAFILYAKSGGDCDLICTGSTDDYRHPRYIHDLIELLEVNNLTSRVKILGYIPKSHQISLLRNCMALIQPTLFEGGPGGGAAYDAISLGIPVIASDIPVNLEMNCGDVTFFKASNQIDLANIMGEMKFAYPHNIDFETNYILGMQRKITCGKVIKQILDVSVRK